MLERGLLSRILFPAPSPSYTIDSFPQDLIWVPKSCAPSDPDVVPASEPDAVPCLLLQYPSARFIILFFHSNAEDLGRCRGFCSYLRDQFQVHVLAVEYPGYGVCPGIASGETVMANALAALRFVTDTLRWPIDSVKVFGRSIGTGPACALASLFQFAGVILVTPFLSVQDLFRDRVGPFATLVEEWFANKDAAPKITSPTMIIHGQRDELISCRHGEALYELCRSRKLLISPPEMEHNTNLLTNLRFFVLPMFQFFALPDYAFQELRVPNWAFDKRRSPFYIRPGMQVSSGQAPLLATDRNEKDQMSIPVGDDDEGPLPAANDLDSPGNVAKSALRAVKQQAALPGGRVTGVGRRAKGVVGDTQREVESDERSKRDYSKYVVETSDESDRQALEKLEDLGALCAGEICSDQLCVRPERLMSDEEIADSEQAMEELQVARTRAGPGGPTMSAAVGRSVVPQFGVSPDEHGASNVAATPAGPNVPTGPGGAPVYSTPTPPLKPERSACPTAWAACSRPIPSDIAEGAEEVGPPLLFCGNMKRLSTC